MDVNLPLPPMTPFDHISNQVAAIQEQLRARYRTKSGKVSWLYDPRYGMFSALVEKDRLYFCTQSNAIHSDAQHAKPDDHGKQLTPTQLKFREVFNEVWFRIPEQDRIEMCTRWSRDYRQPLSDDIYPPLRFRPLIRLVDVGSLSSTFRSIAQTGHELNIDANLLNGPDPVSAIAEILADAYIWVMPIHWGLLIDLFTDPLDEWERKQGENVTDERLAKKEAAAGKKFLRARAREQAGVMERWGFKPSRTSRKCSG